MQCIDFICLFNKYLSINHTPGADSRYKVVILDSRYNVVIKTNMVLAFLRETGNNWKNNYRDKQQSVREGSGMTQAGEDLT